jgi:poly(ADP-ribose) glycohydrolase ARH3
MDQQVLFRKFYGVILGLIVGDTLGAPYENYPGDICSNPVPINKGALYTDDSEMTLNGLSSIIESKGINGYNLAVKYCNFNVGAIRKYGIATLKILDIIKENPSAYKDVYKRFYMEGSFGNGGLMRISPFVLWSYDLDNSELIQNIRTGLEITHLHAYSIESCMIYAKILQYLLTTSLESVKDPQIIGIAKMEAKTSLLIFKLDLISQNLDTPFYINTYRQVASQICSDPLHSFDTLALVLWTFLYLDHRLEPVEMLYEIIKLNKDSDTSAAILGSLLGAKYGVNWIPNQWIFNLEKSELILDLLRKFILLKFKTSKV